MDRPIRFNSVLASIFACVIATSAAAQTADPLTATVVVPTTPALSKIGTDSWASGGSGVVESGLLSAALNNPASLNLSSLTASAELTYRGKASWVADVDYNGLLVAPAFVSVGLPVDRTTFALSYSNYGTERLTFPDIPVTTANSPDGTGEFFGARRQVEAHAFVGSVSHAFDDRLSMGATLGFNYVDLKETFYLSSIAGHGLGYMAMAGMRFSPDEQFAFGAAVRYTSRIPLHVSINPQSVQVDPAPGGNRTGTMLAFATAAIDARFPWSAEIGCEYHLSSAWRVFSALEYQHWSAVYSTFDNTFQLHLGSAVAVSEAVSLRFGFFTQPDPAGGTVSQDFLTGGINLSWKNASLSVSLMDSHLFHPSDVRDVYGPGAPEFHETLFSTGLSYSL